MADNKFKIFIDLKAELLKFSEGELVNLDFKRLHKN